MYILWVSNDHSDFGNPNFKHAYKTKIANFKAFLLALQQQIPGDHSYKTTTIELQVKQLLSCLGFKFSAGAGAGAGVDTTTRRQLGVARWAWGGSGRWRTLRRVRRCAPSPPGSYPWTGLPSPTGALCRGASWSKPAPAHIITSEVSKDQMTLELT